MIDGDQSTILAKLLAERQQPMARWKLESPPPPPITKGDLAELQTEMFPNTH